MDENMVTQDQGLEAEDLLSEELVEEPQDDTENLEDALNETDEPAEAEPQSAGGTPQKEPGYVQSRISKAVEKALAQQREQFEAQMAPMREYMLNQEAQELVRSGKVKDLDTAKELVRYRQGQQPLPVQQTGQEAQPREANGQFASKRTEDPATMARIDMLRHQADRIRAGNGPDVIAEFQNNADIKRRIIAGEMDFYDVAEEMRANKPRRTPAPMRSPNGASGANNNVIETMSDEQFDRLVSKVQKGGRYSIK